MSSPAPPPGDEPPAPSEPPSAAPSSSTGPRPAGVGAPSTTGAPQGNANTTGRRGPGDPPFGRSGPGTAQSAARSIAQQAMEWLYDAVPHLRTVNARVTAWVTQASWVRLMFLGLVLLIATTVIDSILEVNEAIVVHPSAAQKDVTINVKNDNDGVTITPMVGGKTGKPIKVPVPKKGSDDTDNDDVPINIDQNGLHIEKDGKSVVIDGRGVHIAQTPPKAPASPSTTPAIPATPALPAPIVLPPLDESGMSPAERAQAEKERAKAEKDIAQGEKDRVQAEQQKAADLQEEEADRQRQFQADVKEAIADAKDQMQNEIATQLEKDQRVTVKRQGDLAFWGFMKVLLTIFFAYLIAVKVSSGTKRKADAMVRSAATVAEQEGLRRQLLEARLQTMQAQVEPHFLFNTLASVDYLIETDPARASMMQKNLIQYLRASMPQMRGAATQLGREVDLCRAYLEILKVRMEERLQVEIAVPDGLRSADFPPMMLQSMVENAIKHGLEPKAEGGSLVLSAEIFDGNLHVTVADTGLGFSPGRAATSGGGVGLSNIRERLQLLYAGRARLEMTPNRPVGTRASIIVPYLPVATRPAAPPTPPLPERAS